MDPYATSHLSNVALLQETPRPVAHRSRDTAIILTRLAAIDKRQLFRDAGYSSMYKYCVGELHLLEDSACRHIKVARLSRRFPAILIALADHRVSMRVVLMLARHLKPANVDELLAAVTHKSRFQVEKVLAERYPQPDVPEEIQPICPPPLQVAKAPPPDSNESELSAPERIRVTTPEQPCQGHSVSGAQEPVLQPLPVRIEAPVPRERVTPIAPQRYEFRTTFDEENHDLLQDIRALLSHEIPSGEAALVIKYAFKLTKAELLKRKCAMTDRPQTARGSAAPRTIPAEVQRAVWARDGGRCAFVSESGRRCDERWMVEYDHIEPVAQGGKSTIENVRLLCRAHNQFAAERAFGREFMERKRAEADRAG